MKKATASAPAANRRTDGDRADGHCVGPEQTDGRALGTLQRRAQEFGWRCLTDVWSGYHTRYIFECAQGHRFERHASQVLYRQLECLDCQRDALRERWLAGVAARGGALVEGTFTGLLERYRLRCAAGHEWEAQGLKISEGSWCLACAHAASAQRKRRPDGLALLHATAQARGGRCHAVDYTVGRRRYPFECALGHRWEAEGHEVLRGSWCARCARKAAGAATRATHFYHDGLARLQAAAMKHGGQCLADSYVGAPAKYRFRCGAGHEWDAVASQIWLGHWCPLCARLKQRLTIGDMHSLAAERGGLCLSTEYHGKHVKLEWQCHRGHVWQTRPAIVRAGSWCPSCAILERIEKRNSWKRLRYEAVGRLEG